VHLRAPFGESWLHLQSEEQDLKAIQYVRRDAGKPSLQFFESCDASSGDILAGVAAQSGEERVAAQFALADLPLCALLEDHLISYESDEITRLIVDAR
jgi:Ethanolamine ammonia lyase large subunit (EutB)